MHRMARRVLMEEVGGWCVRGRVGRGYVRLMV